MITLIGECKNCGIYGTKVIGTLESIYNQDTPHKCKREGKRVENAVQGLGFRV